VGEVLRVERRGAGGSPSQEGWCKVQDGRCEMDRRYPRGIGVTKGPVALPLMLRCVSL